MIVIVTAFCFLRRFYFSWPRAKMVKTDPFALKIAQVEAAEAAKAAAAANPDAAKPKKPQRPPLSEYNFHPASAQVTFPVGSCRGPLTRGRSQMRIWHFSGLSTGPLTILRPHLITPFKLHR